jgi:hypothetical protein
VLPSSLLDEMVISDPNQMQKCFFGASSFSRRALTDGPDLMFKLRSKWSATIFLTTENTANIYGFWAVASRGERLLVGQTRWGSQGRKRGRKEGQRHDCCLLSYPKTGDF